jgi:Mce-associated membrane protein
MRPATVASAVAALCLPAAAGAALLAREASNDNAVAAARTQAVHAAVQVAHDVLSYDYRSISTDVARAKAESTGVFGQQYAQEAGALAAQARQVHAIVQASVSSPGVVSATADEVVVLAFVDQAAVQQRAGQKSPVTRIDQNRVRLTMTKERGQWLLSQLAAL